MSARTARTHAVGRGFRPRNRWTRRAGRRCLVEFSSVLAFPTSISSPATRGRNPAEAPFCLAPRRSPHPPRLPHVAHSRTRDAAGGAGRGCAARIRLRRGVRSLGAASWRPASSAADWSSTTESRRPNGLEARREADVLLPMPKPCLAPSGEGIDHLQDQRARDVQAPVRRVRQARRHRARHRARPPPGRGRDEKGRGQSGRQAQEETPLGAEHDRRSKAALPTVARGPYSRSSLRLKGR